MKQKNVAIITARGGSKRIPRKNIRAFLGQPLISYSISAALRSQLFDEVMVSTEDSEIADLSVQLGAKIPFYRSEENADDFSSTVDVLVEVLERYKEMNIHFDNFCCLYPTAPFLTPTKLMKSLEHFERAAGDFCISVTDFSYPVQRSLTLTKEGEVNFVYPEHLTSRSQDFKKYYHDVGQFYWGRAESLIKFKSLFAGKCLAYVLPEIETQDIDSLEDWDVAEFKYRYLRDAGRI